MKKILIWGGVIVGVVVAVLLLVRIASGNDTVQDNSTQQRALIGTLSVDTGKLPDDWTAGARDERNVTFTQAATGCFVSINSIADKALTVSDATEFLQVQRERLTDGMKAKGYTTKPQTNGSLTIKTTQGDQSIRSLEFALTGPETLRQSYAYLVRDGYFVQVQRSCPRAEVLAQTLGVVPAISVVL